MDWSRLPEPEDDGAAAHLQGMALPSVTLLATTGEQVNLANLLGRAVLYIYPMTGTPGVALPDGWDSIPGARGCTPQSCAFRDHFKDLQDLGVDHLFGVSAQSSDEQNAAALRLHLPFALLSDSELRLASCMRLPTFQVEGRTLLKRITLVAEAGTIVRVFYPVFPPDQSASNVLAWLTSKRG